MALLVPLPARATSPGAPPSGHESGAPAQAVPEAGSLAIKAVVDEPHLRRARWLLPAPDASAFLIPGSCGANETTLQVYPLGAGSPRTLRLRGQLLAASWVDSHHLAVAVASAQGTTLELLNTTKDRGEPVDTLPAVTPSSSPEGCLIAGDSHALWARSEAGGLQRLILGMRRGPSQFELRRYALRLADDRTTVAERVTQVLGGDEQLRAVLPAASTAGQNLLLWQGSGPREGLQRLALHDSQGAEQSLAYVGAQLAGCSFAAGGRIVCQSRSGVDRGWLWLVNRTEPAVPPQQITFTGQAAAYAVSPDGGQIAYVGSGAGEGPLVVQDLASGTRRQLARLPDASDCAAATTAPRLFWSQPDTLVVRGSCGSSYAVVMVSPLKAGSATAVSAQERPATPSPAVEPPSPGTRKVARHPRPGKRSSDVATYWSPRF